MDNPYPLCGVMKSLRDNGCLLRCDSLSPNAEEVLGGHHVSRIEYEQQTLLSDTKSEFKWNQSIKETLLTTQI